MNKEKVLSALTRFNQASAVVERIVPTYKAELWPDKAADWLDKAAPIGHIAVYEQSGRRGSCEFYGETLNSVDASQGDAHIARLLDAANDAGAIRADTEVRMLYFDFSMKMRALWLKTNDEDQFIPIYKWGAFSHVPLNTIDPDFKTNIIKHAVIMRPHLDAARISALDPNDESGG